MVQWLPIPEFDALYQVSDDGRVWSNRAGREMTLNSNRHGYQQVQLNWCGNRKTFGVHQLVMLAFVGYPPRVKRFGTRTVIV